MLRPRGGLGLIWNERDESVPWVAELSRVMQWDVRMPYAVGTDFRAVLDESGRFTPAQRERFRFEQELDRDGLCERVSTTSYIASMDAGERDVLLRVGPRARRRLPRTVRAAVRHRAVLVPFAGVSDPATNERACIVGARSANIESRSFGEGGFA